MNDSALPPPVLPRLDFLIRPIHAATFNLGEDSVSKNILIFADGTGNESGLLPDESRTNVYKLYRATRTGPDTTINPTKQIAFYIPGVGTPGVTPPPFWKRWWKDIEQAVGGGLTAQIVDCYAAIISVWEPEDRIFLFGFSRGAYCVRCVAHVLEIIGIPRTEADGQTPLSFEPSSLRQVAKRAVKIIYRAGLPKDDRESRNRLAGYFRTSYRCKVGSQESVVPYCVCVFDTVAAVGWLHYGASKLVRLMPFISKNYDQRFPPDVQFARHAMAIDEYRRDFVRVGWGGSKTAPRGGINGVTRFQQVWFAGNHSDVGGSYPENESRLSDITLQWITTFITKELPDEATRIVVNGDLLRLYPSSAGMMHDELMVGHTRANLHIWPAGERKVDPDNELHETVMERLKMPSVRNFTGFGRYRPKSLSEHPRAAEFYKDVTNPPATTSPIPP
jgi:uncharacterized protein (DUF2235 family)